MNWKPLIILLSLSTAVLAVEDPPNCSFAHGGQGNTSQGGVAFTVSRAHVGDTVSLIASLGMVIDACKCVNSTGTLYIATGALTNFMQNVTLNPDGSHSCPSDGLCQPGPYSFVITAPMVGSGVSSPNLTVGGVAKTVRAVSNGFGTVKTDIDEQLADGRSTSLSISTPCIQVFKSCVTACSGSLINFTGYVTNCGDITLTNVTVTDNRTASLFNLDGSALSQPLTLTNNQAVNFKGSFTAFVTETNSATNSITVTGTDTTTIGGPNASVTNSVTTVCGIGNCCVCPCFSWVDPITRTRYALR